MVFQLLIKIVKRYVFEVCVRSCRLLTVRKAAAAACLDGVNPSRLTFVRGALYGLRVALGPVIAGTGAVCRTLGRYISVIPRILTLTRTGHGVRGRDPGVGCDVIFVVTETPFGLVTENSKINNGYKTN